MKTMSLHFRRNFQRCFYIYRRSVSSVTGGPASAEFDSTQSKPKSVFSGIQPTGSLHLGNYFGAVRLWREIQETTSNKLIICVVDMHAMTLPWDPSQLRKNIIQMFVELLACGIDPKRTILFQQSRVSQHAQLQWILSCLTTMARLDNLPQFKEKSAGQQEIPCGIFMYPVLQAADILLYRSELVPVGEDQVQHLQLASHIARTFNSKFGNVFPTPKRLHASIPRLKSLRDPVKKMSKSDTDRRSRIELSDTPDEIREKCAKAVTDSESKMSFEPERRPGLANLLSLHQAVTGHSMEQILEQSKSMNKVLLKSKLADAIIEMLEPIQKRAKEYAGNLDEVERLVEQGSRQAEALAEETMVTVREAIGLTKDLRML